MASTVVGLFDNANEAQAAVRELRDAGFSADEISMIANNATGASDTAAAEGAVTGAAFGGLAGLMIGLAALVIPGIGPVITAGTVGAALASTAVGAALGATIGGLVGALVEEGIPEEDANVYAEGVRRGGALVIVRTEMPEQAARAVSVLNRHNAVDIGRRAQEYRAGGWTRFDDQAEPYDAAAGRAEDRPASAAAPTQTDQQARPRTQARQEGGEDMIVVVIEEALPFDQRSVEPRGGRVYDRGASAPGQSSQ